jgi:FKBP-type peptidyl-prolyl cis-trans isomerase (trigger factor)
MIAKNIVKHPKSIVEVQINVAWADLEPKWNETLVKLGAEIELPGFRKGQAPANMVEQNLGLKLQDEVFKVAMPAFLIEALKGTDIVPIDYPKYEVVNFVKGTGLQFRAMVTNRPAVTVGDYKKIVAKKTQVKVVSEEEMTKVIDDLFKRWKSRAGAQANAGTPAPADGTTEVPDDKFAVAMGAASLADLKTKVKKDMEANAQYNGELDFEESILQEVEKITTVELPDVLIEDELQRMLVSLQRRVADMGLLLEDYLKGQNKTLEQLKAEWKPQAEKNVRMELGLAEIARQENVNISDEDLQAEIDKIQDARVKAQFTSQEPRLHLRHALRQTKTLNLLKTIVAAF